MTRFSTRLRRALTKREQHGILHLVPQALKDIDRDLEQTVKAVERGELDVADLEWESELDTSPPHKVP